MELNFEDKNIPEPISRGTFNFVMSMFSSKMDIEVRFYSHKSFKFPRF